MEVFVIDFSLLHSRQVVFMDLQGQKMLSANIIAPLLLPETKVLCLPIKSPSLAKYIFEKGLVAL